ncbi:MAG: crossover junction endodeoxyribonuclease RuvC [Armatimonadetes bacterium]|nr:crossover junction endodeoxyribonuclease RuvC [Armatimonadota bacterium]
MVILGVDPGLERIGYGLVRTEGSRLEVLRHGLILSPRINLPDRLAFIHREFRTLLSETNPDSLATERLLFAANKTTAFQVAKALGVILMVAGEQGLPWAEYSPPEVKQAVVGNGSADKKQVQFMVRKLLSLQEDPKPDDVADALAIAITHALRSRITSLGTKR